MRDTNDQLKEILLRSNRIKENKTMKRLSFSYAFVMVLCISLMGITTMYIPNMGVSDITQIDGHYGSLLLNTYYMGYVVIGILAFFLGVSTVLLCLQIRKMKKRNRDGL